MNTILTRQLQTSYMLHFNDHFYYKHTGVEVYSIFDWHCKYT